MSSIGTCVLSPLLYLHEVADMFYETSESWDHLSAEGLEVG